MPTCLALCGTTTTAVLPGRSPHPERHRVTSLYEEVVGPACARLGLDLLRADTLAAAGLPEDQILRVLAEADAVVTVLGGSGPEVSFGLGVRHALGRCTVHITEETSRTPLPGTLLHVPLHARPADTAAARHHLTDLLAAALGEAGCGAHGGAPAESAASAEGEDEDAPGLLDLVVEAEAQLEAISDDMTGIESALTDLAEMMVLIGEDMARVDHAGASMNTRMAVINRLAKAIEGPADDLTAAADRFAARMGVSLDAFRAFLEWTAGTPRTEWPEGTEEVLEQVIAIPKEAQEAASAFHEVTTLITMFGSASRQLRRPTRRITGSLRTVFRSVAVLDDLRESAESLRTHPQSPKAARDM